MSLIGDDFTTGDGLTLGVSLVLLEIPDEYWIKQVLIGALNTLTIEANWNDDYGDITAEQAAQIASLVLQTIQFDYEPPAMIPIGAIQMFGAVTAPAGWLLCEGAAVSRATYADLFAVIGTTWGVGNETTTFNLPDFRGRNPIGLANGVVIGEAFGAINTILTPGQIPAHEHQLRNSNSVAANVHTGTGGANPSILAGNGTTNSATKHMTMPSVPTGDNLLSLFSPQRVVPFIIYAGV